MGTTRESVTPERTHDTNNNNNNNVVVREDKKQKPDERKVISHCVSSFVVGRRTKIMEQKFTI